MTKPDALMALADFIERVRSGHFYADYDAATESLGNADRALKALRTAAAASSAGAGTVSVPVLVPDSNSASGQRIEYRTALIPEPAKAGDAVLREALDAAAAHGWRVGRDACVAWCNSNGCLTAGELLSRLPAAEPGCKALSTTAPQPDDGARGNQSDDGASEPINMDLICTLAEAIHDRCFGVSSLKDPHLALVEISDDGGIHEAAHQLIRALPPRANQSDGGEKAGASVVSSEISDTASSLSHSAVESRPSDTAPAEPVAWQVLIKLGWITLPNDWSISERVEGQTYRPLYAHPPRSVDVEAIARVIDPEAFEDDRLTWHDRRVRASNSARSIAALIEKE
jgi:hypothetical protein